MFNLKLRLGILAVVALSTLSIRADMWSERFEYRPEQDKFANRELNYDLYTIWRVPEDVDVGDGHGGIGFGVNYFFTRNLGVGADTFVNALEFPELINTSFIYRYPFEQVGTAPYLFAGAGRKYLGRSQWTCHIGGGLDYRLNQTTGVFIDARWTFSQKTRDYLLIRAGLRLAF